MPGRVPTLSDLIRHSTDRRGFLARSAAVGLTVPLVGSLLDACAPDGTTAQRGAARGAARGTLHNQDSPLDTSLQHPLAHTSSVTPAVQQAAAVPFRRYDPTLPPRTRGGVVRLDWTSREVPIRITPDVVVAGWTFEGDIPGPIVHCAVGDTVEFRLTNHGSIPHSMDFHAAQVDPKTAFRSVAPGQSVAYTFRPRYPGVFVYHCGTAPVLMHIGSGMFGVIVVDPPTPLPPAREFVLVQNEFYLSPAVNGIQPFDYAKMLSTTPDYFAFNGRPSQYQDAPIRVRRGDRVRFYVASVGPTYSCAFHVVGEQFDTVYLGAPPDNAIRGVQTFQVPAGGGMIFELVADVAGEFPFVNHAFGHGQKGAIGALLVE